VNYADRLKRTEWEVRTVPLSTCQEITVQHHYAQGGSNTATYRHGLFHVGSDVCQGIAWWIPPTKSAALATYPTNWYGVLSLSRLVILPGVPKNACSFLLGQSIKLIDRARWPCLVTYADTWQGHTGGIYKATNWQFVGMTKPEAVFVKNGRMLARKAGPHTRTRREMEALGAVLIGRYAKAKFVLILERTRGRKSTTKTPKSPLEWVPVCETNPVSC
jgi:hypothetical protein